MKGLLSILSDFKAVKNQAPKILAEFLDDLLEQNRPLLNPEDGEIQICYLMTQVKDRTNHEYNISIAALSGDNRILRILNSIPLSEAIQTIIKNIPNA